MPTTTSPHLASPPFWARTGVRWAAALAFVAGTFIAGYSLGGKGQWDEGYAQLTGPSEDLDDHWGVNFVTFAEPDTGHAVAVFAPGSIEWVDADGSWHQSGIPDCVIEGELVRYATVKVTIEGQSWRETIAVDCRV